MSQVNRARDITLLEQFVKNRQGNAYLTIDIKKLKQDFALGTTLNKEDSQQFSWLAGKQGDSWQTYISWQEAFPNCTQIEFLPVGILSELNKCMENNQLITRKK